MSRSGNLAEWERRLAAQHREDERLTRERTRREKEQEKVRQQSHHDAQQQTADEQAAAVQEQLKNLDEVLSSVLPLPPMSFDRLMVTPRTPPFDPGPLGAAQPDPDWRDFAPARPGGLRRFLGGGARYERQTAQAQARFEAAVAEHREHESQREQALAVAKAKYHGKVTEERARAAARNAYIARRQSAFAAGDAESVAWFVRCALKASRYPDGFPRGYQVAYDPQDRVVAVEFELPPQAVVPSVRTYRYVKARDVIEPVPRPDHEVRQRYERLICCIALRTVHEIFTATAPEVVRAVSFTGYLDTTDRATGKPVRPHLLSVSAERPAFEDLVMAAVEPTACLAGLGAPTSAGTAMTEPARGGQNGLSERAVATAARTRCRAQRSRARPSACRGLRGRSGIAGPAASSGRRRTGGPPRPASAGPPPPRRCRAARAARHHRGPAGPSCLRGRDAAGGLQARDDGQQLALGAGQVAVQQVQVRAGRAAELACFDVDALLPAADVLQPFAGLLDRPDVRRAVRGLLAAACPAGIKLGLALLQPRLPAAGLGRQRRAGHLDLVAAAFGHAALGVPEPDQRLVEPLQGVDVGVDSVCPPGPTQVVPPDPMFVPPDPLFVPPDPPLSTSAYPRSVSVRLVPELGPAPAPRPVSR